MSFQALGWAVDQKPKRPADKLLLLGLADRHNTEYGVAWPSIAWLVDFSGLDRKTVIAGLARLQEEGRIEDTGRRVGKTKQIIAYGLAFDRSWADGEERQGKVEGSQKRNGSDFGVKGSQKRDTEPIKGTIPTKASPSSGTRARARDGKTACPEDFQPTPSPGTKTAEFTDRLIEEDRLEIEVEKFVAYHTTRKNRYADWQRCWTTWALNNFDGRRENGNGTGHSDPLAGIGNPVVRAAARREGIRRAWHGDEGERSSGDRTGDSEGGPVRARSF